MILTDENILGKGTNKRVYFHPTDPNKCIKFSLDSADETDIKYELEFRRICKDRVEKSILLTKYFGTVETNLGTGYIFELVRDFDGNLSETFESFIKREGNSDSTHNLLREFKQTLFDEQIITYTIFPDNIMVQKISESKSLIRIIDGIGMHVLIPIPYYVDKIAERRELRIWQKFLQKLRDDFDYQGEI